MTILPTKDAIVRFDENEDRLNTFINSYGTYTPNSGLPAVETLPSFVQRNSEALNLLTSTNVRGDWAASTNYSVWDEVRYSGTWYRCVVAHMSSGSFEPIKWRISQGATKDDITKEITKELSYKLHKAYAVCTAASPLVSVSEYQPQHLNVNESLSSSVGNSGVLITPSTSGYFDISLPYGVIIGDSIAEGHGELHGRLHPSFDPNLGSSPGQLSYELSKYFGIPLINHGIGGQTSVQVRSRWPRDVLAQTYNVGDGLPSLTMGFALNRLPYFVYLHVGINDIANDVAVTTIKDNFNYFAQSCRDNNIILVVDNVGPDAGSWFNSSRQANATEINRWLANEFAIAYPEVYQVDYYTWATGGVNDWRTIRQGCFGDEVHPSKAGYALFAANAVEQLSDKRAPLFSEGIVLNSASTGQSNFARITRVTFNGETFDLNKNDVKSLIKPSRIDADSVLYRLYVEDWRNITGSGSYTGYAEIYMQISTRYQEINADKTRPNAKTWTPVANGFTYTGSLTTSGYYYEVANLIFFNITLSVSGGTLASTAGTSNVSLPLVPKRRHVGSASSSDAMQGGAAFIETGAGGVVYCPSRTASGNSIHITGFYERQEF